jgi:ABC-type cobalamin/Fe3+-siderophores transport system ATPase subunit
MQHAGRARRVAIAGALAQRPAVLLLDELTTFLDGEDQGAVLAAVAALARSDAGVTALWVRRRP